MRKYIILFEPMNEFASDEAKKHINEHGYVKNLYSTAVELGYKVIEHKEIFKRNPWNANNTGLLIIEKEGSEEEKENPFACPVSGMPLEKIKNNYYCKDSYLLYPIVNDIPCLLPENSIIATHYLDEF